MFNFVLAHPVSRGLWARRAALLATAAVLLALTGCMYPNDRLSQNQGAPKEAVRNVQAAIDEYKADTGVLPIKNSTPETPLYEKFILDFVPLQGKGYLGDIPSAAFEKGGNYYFLITDEETDPKVRLMDLRIYQQINDISSWVQAYSTANAGKLPKGDEAYPGFYYVDYNLLGKKAPAIVSSYSGLTIAAMLDEKGQIYADYGPDLMQAIQKEGETSFAADFDLRRLLVERDVFVPVKAPVYNWVDGQPQAVS
ncbi:hypothetical protein BBD42_22025 [Paenibacillus sp. BIHB 4019]|uniref:Uncharacterized protein n=1 Tax=Paenibacillus sp. BIHB 4019 TaxID=1870819 RepID=A0A1B2DMB7_9BACL|nr:hypothetical protein [Paenibacillus sp. BIHB 4019]ANY68852.1 hypothetical protein BBD42_22025 [Paenibacillus sp. BIHB 4019]